MMIKNMILKHLRKITSFKEKETQIISSHRNFLLWQLLLRIRMEILLNQFLFNFLLVEDLDLLELQIRKVNSNLLDLMLVSFTSLQSWKNILSSSLQLLLTYKMEIMLRKHFQLRELHLVPLEKYPN